MKSKIYLMSFVIFLLIFASSVYAYKISGSIKDSDTTNPLNNVLVRIEYTNGSLVNSATTDSNGHYTIIINNLTGVYNAKASVSHYIIQSKPFYNNVDQTIDFALKSTTSLPVCIDNDHDGYGATSTDLTNCPGSTTRYDCNDNDASIYPGALEICDNKDNQCSGDVGYGIIDEGVKNTYYRDADVDNYGNLLVTTQACTVPSGYVSNNQDCNDNNLNINPGATEVCGNGIDENCDGLDASCSSPPGGSSGGGSPGGSSSNSCSSNLRDLIGTKTIEVRKDCIISFSYENIRYEVKVKDINPENITLSLLENQAIAKLNNQARLALTSAKDLIFSYDKLDYGKVTITLSTGVKQTTQPVTTKPATQITANPSTTETTPQSTKEPKTPTGASIVNIKKTATGIGVTIAIILLGSVVYYVFFYKKDY